MKIDIEKYGIAVTQSDVERFENSLDGLKLPKDYKDFLVKFNGGYLGEDSGAFKFLSSENGSLINVLYGLNLPEEDDVYGLESNINYLKEDRIPQGFLPIGLDAGGNQLCLGINDDNFGEVWFWDQEEETHEWEEPTMDNMILVAKTFTDFINGLYKFELEDDSE